MKSIVYDNLKRVEKELEDQLNAAVRTLVCTAEQSNAGVHTMQALLLRVTALDTALSTLRAMLSEQFTRTSE